MSRSTTARKAPAERAPAKKATATEAADAPRPVLYTLPNFVTAGSSLLLYNIATHLDRSRYLPTICVSRLGGTALEKGLEDAGIEVFEAPFVTDARPLPGLLWRCRRAAKPFRSRRSGQKPWAIWHSFHYLDDYTEPLIARAAGSANWVFTKKNMSWNRRSWWLRSKLAKGIAAQNLDMIESFFTGSLRQRTVHVPSGVDTETYRPGDRPAGLAPDTFRIGCVAHLLPVKRQLHLVEAMARPELRAHAEGPFSRTKLVLAGRPDDADYAAAIRLEIERHGLEAEVELAGPVDDIPTFLRGLDAFAFPSRGEGCPVALLEAMSTGLPAVATDVAGNRDVIEDGINGRLVPPGDPASLAHALAELRADAELREKLGAAARQRCVERFSTRSEADRYMALYDRILGQ